MEKIVTASDLSLLQPELQGVKTKIAQIIAKTPNNLKGTLQAIFTPAELSFGALLLLIAAKKHDLASSKQVQLAELAVSIDLLEKTMAVHQKLNHGLTKQKDDFIYSGDFLLTEFFDLVIRAVKKQNYLAKNAQVIQKLVTSQIFKLTLGPQATFAEIKANLTAKSSLSALAAEEGAYFAGAKSKEVKSCQKIGAALGANWEAVQLSLPKFRDQINNYLTANKKQVDLLLANLPQTKNFLLLKKINQRLTAKKLQTTEK